MEIVETFFVIEMFLFFVIYCLIFYQNIWIYYCLNRDKHKWFPIFLNPLAISSYELMLNSMFTFKWKKKEGENKKLRKNVNKLSKFLGYLILLVFLTLISILFI